VPKIISERCELMKLCHANGAVRFFLRHSVVDYAVHTVYHEILNSIH